MEASEKVMLTLASQASEAVAAGKTGDAGQLMGDTIVGQVIVGGVTSCTTIVWLQLDVLPQSSVAT